MSGPVSNADTPNAPEVDVPRVGDIDVLDGRRAQVGAFEVNRVLPRQRRRSVGAWCFVDQMGPGDVTAQRGLDIGPHPHIGLQTVTWLLDGEVLHRDSLGSEQLIRAGQLNLMTAGHGVSHSEETAGVYDGSLHGIQLWIAQPNETRHGAPGFEHHRELPHADIDGARATVLVGTYDGTASPARHDSELVGLDLALAPGRTTLPLDASYEHALVVARGAVRVGDAVLAPGQLGYLGIGRSEVAVEATEPAQVLLLGGVPLDEPLLMWWNYVARSRDEITTAHADWLAEHERFGHVASPLARVVTDGPPW